MNFWRDWIGKIKDPACDVYERRYRLFTPIGMVTAGIWLIVISVLDFDLQRLLFFGGMLLAYGISIAVALRLNNIKLGAVAAASGMIFGLMPFVFLTEGGINAGAFNYCITSLIFVLMTMSGRLRTFFLAADVAVATACFAVCYYHPELVRMPDTQIAYLDAFTEMIITSIMAFSAIVFQLYVFRQERELLEKQRNEIGELNRAQNRFFSSMSHEIRTPINSIIGLNELNMRDESVSDAVRANNRNIQGASRMLLALINDILDMSKMESGRMEIVPVAYDTGTLMSEVVNMIWGRAEEKKLQFLVDVDPSVPARLYGDEVRIRQVLINLLNNAVKYTHEGSVRLSVQCDRLNETEALVTWRVEDTGMGIKKEAIPYLFDAFKRVDVEANRSIEGTGLGLSIVKQIATLMGGEIAVDSVYTKGSVFTFTLKQEIVDATDVGSLDLRSNALSPDQEGYRQSFEAPGASLLIVDDNELNLQVESALLAPSGMKIDLAKSGTECLTMTFRRKYDCIFMDHLMPGMDGIETLQEIRAQRGGLNGETPVIVLTANAGSENQALYKSAGFDGYLVKPVSSKQMEETLIGILPADKMTLTGAVTVEGKKEMIAGHQARNRSILVTCETGADLPEYIMRRYRIPAISFRVYTGKGMFYDNRDVDSDGLLDYLEDPAHSVRTSPPAVSDYEAFFAEQLSRARHIVHITFGKEIAEGYRVASEAAASFDNVTVFDSGSISGATGLLVLYATWLSEREEDIEAFLEKTERVKNQIRARFVVDSAEQLARAGRIPKPVQTFTGALMLHPVLRTGNNRLVAERFLAGERSRYRRSFIRHALKDWQDIDTSLLCITYSGITDEELQQIVTQVKEELQFEHIFVQKATSAVAANSGRNSFGLMYRVRDTEYEAERRLFGFLPPEAETDRTEDRTEAPVPVTIAKEPLPAEEVPQKEDAAVVKKAERGAFATEEMTGLQQFYRETGMLDYDEALLHLSDERLMEKALRHFCESIEKNADEIERLLEEGDIENYTIKVHALKSSAKLIGAEELSDRARMLEAYGSVINS